MRARAMLVTLLLSLASCGAPPSQPDAAQVLFVCEHGNVKSLMAASYFNELAHARALPFRAVSRASAPDSDTVPDFVRSQLSADGFDVSTFRPEAVSTADLSASQIVITIGTDLPASAVGISNLEQWNDIPPASSDFQRSSAALKSRITELLERLQRDARR